MNTTPDRIPLDLFDSTASQRRIRTIVMAAIVVILAAVAAGFPLGYPQGLIVPGVVVILVVFVVLLWIGQGRRRSWIDGSVVFVRTLGTRSVDLHATRRLELLMTEMRGVRTISLLATSSQTRQTVTVPLASYTVIGAKELDVLALRRLADALAGTGDASGLVLSELLVSQLRAEARGEAMPGRPLYQLTSVIPASRRLAQRIHPEAVASFVTALD